jgi:membrane-bound lytic murein transglycosylase F
MTCRRSLNVTLTDDLLAESRTTWTLRIDLAVTGSRPLAWGIRQSNPMLRDTVDAFLAQALPPAADRPTRQVGDLADIRARKVLRVLTRNNSTSYFIWRGQLMGFEHDLAAAFARSQGLQVEFVVAPTRASLSTWLLEGVGDLVAAGLTRGDSAEGLVAYSRSYHRVVEMAVTDTADTSLRTVADLAGRTIAVRVSSPYWETANGLKRSGIPVQLLAFPKTSRPKIIDGVATGAYDVTLADSHILGMELTWRDDIGARSRSRIRWTMPGRCVRATRLLAR